MTTSRSHPSPRRGVLASLLSLLLLAPACASGDERGPAVAPAFSEGKQDAADHVVDQGALGFGADAAHTAEITEDLVFHGHRLTVRPGAVVSLEITQLGSSRGLDTTLYVYGPRDADGRFGATALAFDDDAGWGPLSRLRDLALKEGGEYLVVVGTHDGRGRGRYRLLATCPSGDCAPAATVAACHPAIAGAIDACVADWHADPDFDPDTLPYSDVLAACADPEVAAPAWDTLCAADDAPRDVCDQDIEAFATTYLPRCQRALYDAHLDDACVFGEGYRDLFGAAEALVVVWTRELDARSALTALEGEQILRAVQATAYDDVKTLAEAFEAVDDHVVNQHEVWDASARRAFTVYEVGAGDNSFGAYFAYGATTPAAVINDGYIESCTATWGPERRRCASDDDCAGSARCVGTPPEVALGRCVDVAADAHSANGASCVGADGCPAASGLICGGAISAGSGLCLPAWMRSSFASAPALGIPDRNAGGAETQLLAWGLATTDVEVQLDLLIVHPRVADLRVTLTNPSDNELLVFDGEVDGGGAYGELSLHGVTPKGLSGDESVNGLWRLRVVDRKSGQTGTVERFGLTITSRWD